MKRKQGFKCEAKLCQNYYGNTVGVSFFGFPKDLSLRKKWVTELKNPKLEKLFEEDPDSLNYKKVCAKHFYGKDFSNPERNRLLPNSHPKVFETQDNQKLPEDSEKEQISNSKDDMVSTPPFTDMNEWKQCLSLLNKLFDDSSIHELLN